MDRFICPFPEPPVLSIGGEEFAVGGGRDGDNSTALKLRELLIVRIITCVFALVSAPIGAVSGAWIGLRTETGLVMGAGIGAISGAVFAVEAVESFISLWHLNESGILSILYVVDIICSLLSGKLIRDKVTPAVERAVQRQLQINALELYHVETIDIFETGSTRGMRKETVDLLPKLKITSENIFDCSGERRSCSVCLQDIQDGETVRSLPHCQHMFHSCCIDSWLVRNGSCPICRRDI